MNCPTSGSTQQAGAEFVALSRFTVANGMADQVKDAFINRSKLCWRHCFRKRDLLARQRAGRQRQE